MTVENTTTPAQALRLSVEYLSAGLSELEIAITRRQLLHRPRSLRLDDSAGNVAQALTWIREHLESVELDAD